MLADGSIVRTRYYRATILWHGQPRPIMVLEANSDPLAGMSLLYGSRLVVDVVDGGTVTVQPLP
jgi:predicted aspartyl protease